MKKYWNLLLCSFLLVFTVGCSGNSDGDEPEGETGELLLTSSAAYIENNGTDQAVFTVMKGKKNVPKLRFIRRRVAVMMFCLLLLFPQKHKVNILSSPAIIMRCLLQLQ